MEKDSNLQNTYSIRLDMIIQSQQEIEDLIVEYELSNMESYKEANDILNRFKK